MLPESNPYLLGLLPVVDNILVAGSSEAVKVWLQCISGDQLHRLPIHTLRLASWQLIPGCYNLLFVLALLLRGDFSWQKTIPWWPVVSNLLAEAPSSSAKCGWTRCWFSFFQGNIAWPGFGDQPLLADISILEGNPTSSIRSRHSWWYIPTAVWINFLRARGHMSGHILPLAWPPNRSQTWYMYKAVKFHSPIQVPAFSSIYQHMSLNRDLTIVTPFRHMLCSWVGLRSRG